MQKGNLPVEVLFCYSHCFAGSHHYSYIIAVVSEARFCVVQEEKERIAVRGLYLSPAFLPCRLGKEQVGTVLSAIP